MPECGSLKATGCYGTTVVTGASGLLGANLVLTLSKQGKDVVAISHRCRLSPAGVRSFQADLSDPCETQDLLSHLRPDWVVHCAALTKVDWCEGHPQEAYRVNAEMPRYVAAAARLLGARVVYISTDAVFSGEGGPYSEEDALAPVNVYAKSKLAGEQAVRDELPECLILRTNIFGWNLQEKYSMAEWILRRLEAGELVPAFRDVIFTPILANDLCQIILEMMGKGFAGLYHVAGSQSLSKYEFALRLADVFGQERHLVRAISIANSDLIAPRSRNMALATGRITQELGRGMPSAEAGLARFLALDASGWRAHLQALRG